MLNEDRAREIFRTIERAATGDGVEAIISHNRSSLTRFANNTIHQNVAEEGFSVSIRALLDGRDARVTTNRVDEEGLRRAVASAEAIARVQERDPDMLPLPPADAANSPQPAPSRHVAQTAALTPLDRAEGVRKIVDVAKKNSLTTAGIFSSSDSADALLNSNGLLAFHRHTLAEISITMLAEDSSGWQKLNSPDISRLDPVLLAEIAAQKARDTSHPVELPPGKYTVVLEPSAVLDLVGFMFWDFGGLSVLDQRSFLQNRVGTRLLGENITIWDDAYHPFQAGAPFDGEGLSRKRVPLVEKGVVRNLVYARATAEKMKRSELAASAGQVEPTGHGFPLPNEMGEAPVNIVFEGAAPGQAKSVDEMVADTERGILVTRLWYIREVEPYEKILTGMTRDGTFLIENGKVRQGVRNFRFNQGLVELLNNVEAMSASMRACGEEAFDMVVPAMKVRDFNFTEVTRF